MDDASVKLVNCEVLLLLSCNTRSWLLVVLSTLVIDSCDAGA